MYGSPARLLVLYYIHMLVSVHNIICFSHAHSIGSHAMYCYVVIKCDTLLEYVVLFLEWFMKHGCGVGPLPERVIPTSDKCWKGPDGRYPI